MSKGSKQRPTDLNAYGSNYDLIFRKDKMSPHVKDNGDDFGTCGCGRSPTGKCIGWHGLTEEAYKARLEEFLEHKTNSEKQ
jgi:hypothetical protein